MPVRSVSIAAPGVKVRPAALPLSLPLSLSRARGLLAPALLTTRMGVQLAGFKLPSDLLRQLHNYERIKFDTSDVTIADGVHLSLAGKMTGWTYMRPTVDAAKVRSQR